MKLPKFSTKWKFYFLPSPKDLGWSNSNALKMASFSPYQEGKSWEDWRVYCQEHYPFRYFIAETLRNFLARKWYRLSRALESFKDHYISKKYLLDLSKVGLLKGDKPHYGYSDPCHRFWAAGWHALESWVAEKPYNPHTDGAEADDHYLKNYDEAMALYHYWTVTRQEREDENQRLYNLAKSIESSLENEEIWRAAQDEWLKHYRETDELDRTMFMRLAAIREFLWT